MRITAVAGGVGAAKLLVGLDRLLGPALSAVVNTGDDAEIYGLHVSPDVDIVTYWLAGVADMARGWGIAGDRFEVVDALGRLGAENWFRLGDRDLATCLYRTRRLNEGATLSQITSEISRAFGVRPRVLAMSDDPVRTVVKTRDGRTLQFQEYFVKERTEPAISEVLFEGARDAAPGPGVVKAIAEAERIIICPSNPLLSIGPILALAEIRSALAAHPSVVAVTPLIRGKALKGPADRLLAGLGIPATASGVASLYRGICDTFVVDASDADEIERVRPLGMRAVALPTVMHDHDTAELVAKELLSL